MKKDSLEPLEPKEQTKASLPARTSSPVSPARTLSSAGSVRDEAPPVAPTQHHLSVPRISFGSFGSGPRNTQAVRLVAAFAAGAVGLLVLFMVIAFSFSGSYANRVLPGVKVGSVDLSGSTRDEAISKLKAGYASLSSGQIVVTTPVGTATISFAEAGRAPDVEAMADAALSVGHSGGGLGDAIAALHSAVLGASVPVVVHVDPNVLAQRLHDLVGKDNVAATSAQASLKNGNFSFTPASAGRGFDERLMASTLIDELTKMQPAGQLQTGGTFTDLKPAITDKDAQDAITRAEKIVVPVKLTWSKVPAVAPVGWTPKEWTIDAATIHSWVVFDVRPDGKYGPTIDLIKAQAYLSGLSVKANIQPVEPTVNWDESGTKPVSLKESKDGAGIDFVSTSGLIVTYLDSVGSDISVGTSIEVATMPIRPQITDVASMKGMVLMNGGTAWWTTTFFPGVSNGFGKNIRQPAINLNGLVIGPGQQFSFLGAVGTIDEAHGFALGGVILHGLSDHTGAMGGGICSASTTFFNAAARAGLQIDERHAHSYYVNRYPIGRDATVYSNGTSTLDLKWTNDTPNPIVIRSWATYGTTSSITVQLWSLPLIRTVEFTGGAKTKVTTATDGTVYVSAASLKPGVTYRAEYVTDGFDTTVNRVVKDETGAVLHSDVWQSHYTKVNGVLQIGATPVPSGSMSPSPGAPTPTPAPVTPAPVTPAPTVLPPAPVTPAPVTPAPRRRKVA